MINKKNPTMRYVKSYFGSEQGKYMKAIFISEPAESEWNLDAVSKHLFRTALTRVGTLRRFLTQCIWDHSNEWS